MAATVNKVTPHKMYAEISFARNAWRQMFHRPVTAAISKVTFRGATTTPTQRSVAARLRYKSLDGGWRAVTFLRASRIRVFSKNAVTDRIMFSTRRKINWFCIPLVNSTEQNISSPVFFLFSIGGEMAHRYLSAVCTLVTGVSRFYKATTNILWQ